MNGQEFLKKVFFVIFFTVGAGALVLSSFSHGLSVNYKNRQSLRQMQKNINRLESLNRDYDELLNKLEKDPSLLKRAATVTFGIEPNDPNTIYPKSKLGQLDAARKALDEENKDITEEPNTPPWLVRCTEHNRRLALFISGGFLILISFVCFGPTKESLKRKKE